MLCRNMDERKKGKAEQVNNCSCMSLSGCLMFSFIHTNTSRSYIKFLAVGCFISSSFFTCQITFGVFLLLLPCPDRSDAVQ